MRKEIRKGYGFSGQRTLLLPTVIEQKCKDIELISSLFISSMGYFPEARYHFFQRPHGISQAILIYCTNGKGWVQVRKEKMLVVSGDLIIIPPDVFHNYGADPERPWSIYWFHLKGKTYKELNALILGSAEQKVRPIGVSAERIALFDSIYEVFSKGYSHSNLLYANLTLRYFLASCLMPNMYLAKLKSISIDDPVNKAIECMRLNLQTVLKLKTIASASNFSISYFSGLFKKSTGYSPIDYLNQLRIQKSCQFLAFSNLRINEIASEVGINDPFYFSRLFKHQMGVSPVEYRKSMKIKEKQ